jgi:hypothetical protein
MYLVVSASTNSTPGFDLSAQYVVNHNLAPVLGASYGICDSQLGSSLTQFYNSLWQQAAAQGIMVGDGKPPVEFGSDKNVLGLDLRAVDLRST